MTAPEPGRRSYYAPPEGVAITPKYWFLGPSYGYFKLQIFVDGVEASVAGWDRTAVPAAAGRHTVQVHTKYLLRSKAGPADYTVEVPPGEYVELEYRAPIWASSRGSLGPPPQRYNGVWPMVALFGACALIIVIALIAAA